MSENFAGWVPAEGAPGGVPAAPGEAGAMALLPASVRRAQEAEDRAQARQARADAKERESRVAHAEDRALAAYIEGAALRGETVGARDIISGNVGRTWEQITAGPASELADRIPKAHREPVNFVDAPVRRMRPARDGDVIGRAMLAAEARRLDQRGKAAAEVMEKLAARRAPARLEDAWAAWRWR